jgi:hypothetical protein
VSAGYCQRAPVGESGMIRTQMGKQNTSVMVAVYGTPCVISYVKQQQYSNGDYFKEIFCSENGNDIVGR